MLEAIPGCHGPAGTLADLDGWRENGGLQENVDVPTGNVLKGRTGVGIELLVTHTAVLAEVAEGSQGLGASIDEEGDVLSICAEVKIGVVDVVASESEGQFVDVRRELPCGEDEEEKRGEGEEADEVLFHWN